MVIWMLCFASYYKYRRKDTVFLSVLLRTQHNLSNNYKYTDLIQNDSFALSYFRPNSKAAKVAFISPKGKVAASDAIKEQAKKMGKLTYWEAVSSARNRD